MPQKTKCRACGETETFPFDMFMHRVVDGWYHSECCPTCSEAEKDYEGYVLDIEYRDGGFGEAQKETCHVQDIDIRGLQYGSVHFHNMLLALAEHPKVQINSYGGPFFGHLIKITKRLATDDDCVPTDIARITVEAQDAN